MSATEHSNFDGPVNGLSTRKPPFNLQAEQALLGALLLDNSVIEKVSDFLRPSHFYEPLHGLIYETAVETIKQGRRATPITLRYHLESQPPIDGTTIVLTIPEYLARLARGATTTISARDYAQTVFDLAMRRQVILACEDTAATAYDASVNATPAVIVDEGLVRLHEISKLTAPRAFGRPFTDIVSDTLAQIEATFTSGKELAGLSTGFKDLDAKLGGLQSSDFIVLAGRPGIGKTSFAVNLGVNVAKLGTPVGVFSMEMSDQQLVLRIISERAEVSSDRMRRGKVAVAEWPKIKAAADGIRSLPLYVDQTGALTIAQLTARARQWHREHKLGLVIVDYIQLMAGSGNRTANRTNEITEITMGLKALAKELNAPVLGLSQLSRQVETRDDKRPMLADLRESGSIEQDSDVVMFVYRDAYYLEQREPPFTDHEAYADWSAKMQAAVGLAEIIIAKQRHGPTGIVKMAFNQELTRFSDLARGNG